MNFVKAALFALFLVALLVPVSTPPVSAGTPHRCPEEEHDPRIDYSLNCAAQNTRWVPSVSTLCATHARLGVTVTTTCTAPRMVVRITVIGTVIIYPPA